jgi:4-hydroxythreonine-4-phosphate dehydrogenase
MSDAEGRPLVALTMGDVAGVGPELIVRAWGESALRKLARPIVIGSRAVLERAITQFGRNARLQLLTDPAEADPSEYVIPCFDPTGDDLIDVHPGQVSGRAGRAAYDYLVAAIDLAMAKKIDAITTLPLQKESLSLGGIKHPGHTEILAERCGVREHAMMLYLDHGIEREGGLAVLHATLHVALRKVFDLLTIDSVAAKIRLADDYLPALTQGRRPRIAVAGLNPHAGENGLFGDEEQTIIGPAVALCRNEGINVQGPIPADTLFGRALKGEFDAVIAMYHDQGHVALKTIGFDKAVNVTLGLPIVRTSVAHGTAFDIAWKGLADTTSLIQATWVASRIVSGQRFLEGSRSA